MGRPSAAAGIAIAGWLRAAAAVAQAAAAGPSSEERAVDLVVAAGADDADALEAALREPLRRLGVVVHGARVARVDPRDVVTPMSGAAPAVARVWIDARTGAERATFYLADAGWDRILVRHVPLPRGLDEVAREELALIARTSVEALLAGARIGVSREEATERIAPVPAAPSPDSRPAGGAPPRRSPDRAPHVAAGGPAEREGPALEIGVGYEVGLYAPERPVAHGPGASFAVVASRGPVRPGGWASAAWRVPFEVERSPIGARFEAVEARVLGIADLPVPGGLVLRAGLGGGADLVHAAPRTASGAQAAPARPAWTTVPVARVAAGAERAVGGSIAIAGMLAVDADLVTERWIVDRDGPPDVVLAPWRVRPAVIVGVKTAAEPAGADRGR